MPEVAFYACVCVAKWRRLSPFLTLINQTLIYLQISHAHFYRLMKQGCFDSSPERIPKDADP